MFEHRDTTFAGVALTTGVTTEWSTVATATPIANVEAAVQKVYDNSGRSRRRTP